MKRSSRANKFINVLNRRSERLAKRRKSDVPHEEAELHAHLPQDHHDQQQHSPQPGPSQSRLDGRQHDSSPEPGPSYFDTNPDSPDAMPSPDRGSDGHSGHESDNEQENKSGQVARVDKSDPFSYVKEKIYEDHGIMATVQKKRFLRQARFRYADSQWAIRFTYAKNADRIAIINLLVVLEQALLFIVELVYNYYKKLDGHDPEAELTRQFYLVILIKETSAKARTNLSTGNYGLNESPRLIVQACCSAFFDFLLSDMDLDLSRGITFYLKTLSIEHVLHRIHNKRNLILSKRAKGRSGHVRYHPHNLNRYLFYVPVGYAGAPDGFKHACLPVALILGRLHRLYCKDPESREGKAWNISQHLHSQDPCLSKAAGNQIALYLSTLRVTCNIGFEPGYVIEELVPKVGAFMTDVQYIFLDSKENYEVLYMYPTQFNSTLAPVFLSFTEETNSCHIDVIVNPETLARRFGIDCYVCGGKEKSMGMAHMCSRQSCNICRRPLLKEGDYYDSQTILYHCDSRLNPLEKQCEKCLLTTRSLLCQKRHDSYVCYEASLCPNEKCQQRISHKGFKTKEEAHAVHICNAVKCSSCYEFYFNKPGSLKKHCCKFRQFKRPQVLKNIMVLSMKFREVKRQDEHALGLVPYIASICYEDHCKEFFTVETIVDPDLNIPTEVYEEKQNINLQYLVEEKIKYKSRALYRAKWLINDTVQSMLDKASNGQSNSFLEQLVKKLISWRFRSYTIIVECHMTMSVILKALSNQGIKVYIVGNQISHINSITIQALDISFCCMTQYIDLPIWEISDTFKTLHQKIFLPDSLVKVGQEQYCGEVPELDQFCISPLSIAKMDKITKFYSTLFPPYDLGSNIVCASQNDCLIMAEAIVHFLVTSFEEQAFLFKELNIPPRTSEEKECFPYFYPFSARISSVSGYYYQIFALCCGLAQKLVCSPHATKPLYDSCRSSRPEAELVEFIAYKYKQRDKKYYSSTTKWGQFTGFNHMHPDGYFPDINLAVFYHGCHHHGCNKKTCKTTKGNTSKQAWKNKSYGDLYIETEDKTKRFRESYPEIQLYIVWGCEFSSMKKSDPEVLYFIGNIYKPMPEEMFTIGASAHPPQTSVYAHRWNAADDDLEKMYCLDQSSCYASVMLNHSFPIGQGIHYFERDFDTYYDSKNCTFEGIPCQGLIQVEVLPPKIRFPFLFQKLKDGSKNYPICSQCSENELTKVCKHKDHLKSFYCIITCEELQYSLTLGYKLIRIVQGYIFTETEPIFRKTIALFCRSKLIYSGVPNYITNVYEYCRQINSQMGYSGSSEIIPDMLQRDDRKRYFIKRVLCMLTGNLIRRSYKTSLIVVNKQKDIDREIISDRLRDIEILSDEKSALLLVEQPSKKFQPSRNMVSGVYVYAFARLFQHKMIMSLYNAGARLLYVDTDCYYITMSKPLPNFIVLSECIGCFKLQYSPSFPVSWTALSPKTYSIILRNHDGTEYEDIKAKGLNLKCDTGAVINNDSFRRKISSFINNLYDEVTVEQIRTFTTADLETYKRVLNFSLNFKEHGKRLIDKSSSCLNTYPYGFKI